MSQNKDFTLQARRFHLVANEKVLPELNKVLNYLTNRCYLYILCRKGFNKRNAPHAHIYVAFQRAVRLSTKNTCGCHIAKCRGTSKQNVAYIKDHHPIEVCEKGTLPENDGDGVDKQAWDKFVQSIHDGTVDKDSRLYAQYEGYARRRMAELKPKRTYNGDLKAKNLWLWGKQRTGKSYWVDNFLPKPKYEVYDKEANKWWDGFQGEKIVHLADLSKEDAPFLPRYIKKWADRYPINAAIKGGSMRINTADFHFIVTSQYSIEELFEDRDAKAIKERFEEWHITEKMPNLPGNN